MRYLTIAGCALLLSSLLTPANIAQQPPPPPPPAPEPAVAAPAPETPATTETAAPAAEEALPACTDCHDAMKAFGSNPHGIGKAKKDVIPNALCETCHGPGKEHILNGGDKTKIYKPAGVEGANKTCLTCHDTTTDRTSRRGGMHANSAAVNCLTCHSIHNGDAHTEHLLAASEMKLCSTCHATQVSSFRNQPYAHRLGRGGMECDSCHEPHGRPGRDSLRLSRAGEVPCLTCHADKRGPHVFEHGALAIGDCTTCHAPHGSPNPKRLTRSTVAQLCIECHSPAATATLGSQPPSFHDLTSPRYRNCTTCHVAIHGSNRDPQLLK